MHHAEDSSHISQRLEIGRKALETMASIASQLENAKDGLVKSAYLASNIEDLPPAIRRLWESLDKDFMIMPAQELWEKLSQIEQHLSARLMWLTPYIEKICADEKINDDVRIREVRLQTQDLARLAGTALAIRMLAHRKNFKFPPGKLPVRADDLREKAQRIKKIERVHKLRVINHMHDMVKATTGMLQMPNLDASMRAMLKGVLHDLQMNVKHLANGGSFASLPVPIEEVELQEPQAEAEAELSLVEDEKPVQSSAEQTTKIPVVASQPRTATASGRPVSPQMQAASVSSKKQAPVSVRPLPKPVQPPVTMAPPLRPRSVPQVAPQMNGSSHNAVSRFFRQFYIWIKSPLSVTWNEARLIMMDDDDF